MNEQASFEASEEKYREFVLKLGDELERRRPGVFAWRFGKPSENVVEGLIITKPDVAGYVFAVGSSAWSGMSQGGVWREGARHSYSVSVLAEREWERPDLSHFGVRHLESRCSESAAEIVDWLVKDWAYERTWCAPSPTDAKAEKLRLRKIVDGMQARSSAAVVAKVKPGSEHDLTPDGLAALKRDLAGLSADAIRVNFPPDKRGRFALKTVVVLGSYETTSSPGHQRSLCLVVNGPARRVDEQALRVSLEPLIEANQDHRWENERWKWHEDSAAADRAARWGAPVPIEALSAGTLSAAQWLKKAAKGRADDGERAVAAMLLQEEGRLVEALESYGIAVDGNLKRLCGGQKIYPPACCAYADEKWVTRLQDWLRSCAPWLVAQATRREAERIAAWTAEKKGRRRRLPLLKLLIFPGQHHSRKASLVLTSTDMEGWCPRLEMQATASNARLHESAWRRELELDLARYRLERPATAATGRSAAKGT